MIGIDTNVLLRWLISPDEWDIGSTKAEIALVEKTLSSDAVQFFVNPIVIAETTWILEQKLKLDRESVCEVVDRLLYSNNIVVGDIPSVTDARQVYEASNVGFADCLIGKLNQSAGCSYTFTFDKKAARQVGFRNINAGD